MPNFVPVIVAGGAFILLSRRGKNRRRKARTKIKQKSKQKALPESSEYGEVYNVREVDIIEARTGENFTMSLGSAAGTGYTWELSASPPDNSIKALGHEVQPVPGEEGIPGGGQLTLFKFKAAKPGSGSLVFHFQRPWMKGKEPPHEIVEVETKVSEAS